MTEVPIPQDPLQLITDWLREYLIPLLPSLSGFTTGGTYLKPGVTPDRYIRVMLVGNQDYQRVGDRVSVRIQVWRAGTEHERNMIANEILAFLRAKLAGRKEAGPFSVPDPADSTKHLSQFEVSLLLIGKGQT